MKTNGKKASRSRVEGGLTWDAVSARLVGQGPLERNADTSGCAKRVKLPDPYFDPEQGFPELLKGIDWMLTFRAEEFLVAVPLKLWPEFVARLRREICEEGELSEVSFKKLHIDRAHRVRADNRNRWLIHADLSKELPHDDNDRCSVVFQTREATIELRSRKRHFNEQRAAQLEAEQLRLKAAAQTVPADPIDQNHAPSVSRCAGLNSVRS